MRYQNLDEKILETPVLFMSQYNNDIWNCVTLHMSADFLFFEVCILDSSSDHTKVC